MGAQMPEGPIDANEPIDPVDRVVETSADGAEVRSEALPVAAPNVERKQVEAPSPTPGPLPLPVAAALDARKPEVATIRLEKKHPLAIRWMHWVNFPVLFTMIWSGLLIYWGDSDNAYQHPHRVYRIGIGAWTLFRFFPEAVYRWLNA